MPTLVCVPLHVEDVDQTLTQAQQAKEAGADLVEFRIDTIFAGSTGSDEEDARLVAELQRLLAESPLPVVLTCRDSSEGGEYDGNETDRVSLLEKLTAACPTPPAYLDFELARYQASANIRQKINLCVSHPKQTRDITTRLILSIHDFDGRPDDLHRRLADAYTEPACSVVKVAFRCRSLRDNHELFEILSDAPKPTIALGMGEFGLMSRVLAPKFKGFLTFASLTDTSSTAPGQPTIAELLQLYRFRSIDALTRLYGVVGWPVTQSLSPLIHNTGFGVRGVNAVYLPMPVGADPEDKEATSTSFKAFFETFGLRDPYSPLQLSGLSITIPFKEHAFSYESLGDLPQFDQNAEAIGAVNTFSRTWTDDSPTAESGWEWADDVWSNTDALAIEQLLGEVNAQRVVILGAGGVARAALAASRGREVTVLARSAQRAQESLASTTPLAPDVTIAPIDAVLEHPADIYINCTPVGMVGGPAPENSPIDVDALFETGHLSPQTIFFDTVYNPIETPMLRAAKSRGCRVIDGVEMFIKQAAAQFEMWTGEQAPADLFDRLIRETISARS